MVRFENFTIRDLRNYNLYKTVRYIWYVCDLLTRAEYNSLVNYYMPIWNLSKFRYKTQAKCEVNKI